MTIINHSRYTKVISSKTRGVTTDISVIIPPNSWGERRCFVLAGGCSLNGFDFNRISGELTIGVNKSFASFPVLVNYSMDPKFYDMVSFPNNDPTNPFIHNKWVEYHGIKVFLNRRAFPNVYTVNPIDKKSISLDPSIGIYPGGNSAFGALMLAISFGCKRIGLLGLDMKVDTVHQRTHHHEGYKGSGQIKDILASNQRKLNQFKGEFDEFAPMIKQIGVEVFNLNPDSDLHCFPKVQLKEFMGG